MAFNHDAGRNGAGTQMQQPDTQGSQLWKDLSLPKAPPKRSRRGRVLVLVSVMLLIALIFAGLRFSALATGSDDQMQISIGSQQTATLDLRQSFPISPDLYGVNIFPENTSNSVDQIYSGFLPYTPTLINGLQSMGVKLMRFPGGNWGEKHVLSYDQLGEFAKLLNETNADGIIQANFSGMKGADDINSTSRLAGQWVDFMNNTKSYWRSTGNVAYHPALSNGAYHPVALWTVDNEPDQKNIRTDQQLTVADYANDFIQFSKEMHRNDNSIKVFGPELSRFYGIGAGPFDSQGQSWMEAFLKAVSDYEKANKLPYHLLDGVSFHDYPFDNAQRDPAMLLSNSDTWNYVIPPLHTLIMRDFGRDMPIAITEINTNPSSATQPTRGAAALWWADTLGSLMNQQVQYVGYFSVGGTIENPYPLYAGAEQKETPMMRVMQLFSHLQHNVIPLSIQHDPVSVYATMDDAHQVVSLLFVNKLPSNQLVQIRPMDKFLSVSAWPSIDVSLQGYGMVVMTLHRGLSGGAGTAEAYSYTAPPNDGSAVVPVKYTQCGNRTDPLTSDVPC